MSASSPEYWEARAKRYARSGPGLGAVCSYGMPGFYNRAIDLLQRRALQPWLEIESGSDVLDVGCGVGRWSRRLAQRGARVTAVDVSETMLRVAAERARAEGLAVHLVRSDLAELNLGRRFPLIVGVTVLQHLVEDRRYRAALAALRRHLAPAGRLVLLEVAPAAADPRCDRTTFTARALPEQLAAMADAGLCCRAVTGVDPVPLKVRYLPLFGRLPRPLAVAGLALVTGVSLPLDLLLAPHLARTSWHKVLVLERGSDAA